MNRKALVAACAAAVIGMGLLWLYMERFEEEASGGVPIPILMATQDIPLGATITQDMLGIRPLPSSYVEERHIRSEDAERILGVRVSMGVRAAEAILWTDLATTTQQRRDLSGLVQSGMRAITVRADVTSSFGGLLRPGDRVDVILTAQRGSDRGSEQVTLSLLQNVLVLAVGQDTGGDTQDGRNRGSRRRSTEVTMSVTVEQAQALTYASRTGRLSLALRNPDDIAIMEQLPETTRGDILRQETRRNLIRREPRDEAATVPTPLR